MPPAKRAKRGAAAPAPLELRYFPVMAKGLGCAIVCEYSGLPWMGSKELGFLARGGPPGKNFADIKASLPFGQLPLLTTAEGEMVAQTTAIINFVGKTAGIEGDGRDYAVSQMLIAEAEDLYALTNKCVPTIVAPLNQGIKGDKAQYDTFWNEKLPPHLAYLEKLCAAGAGFHETPGSLYLFSILHQLALVKPGLLKGGKLGKWYAATLADRRTVKVLAGESSIGELKQYFIAEP